MIRPLLLTILSFNTLFSQEWIEITPSTGLSPGGRTNTAAIYDNQNHRMVVFGGRGVGGEDFNDIWVFDLESSAWSELAPQEGSEPAPRRTPNCIYDPDNHAMVMWSGQSGTTTLNDVWIYDFGANTWSEWQPPDPKPNRRYGTVSVFDPVGKELVTFAGFTSSGRFNDSWRFDLESNIWTDVTPGDNLPQVRCLHSASYNSLDHQMIIYGGQRSGALADIWAFGLSQNRWTELTPEAGPSGRWFPTNVYDPGRRAVVIFGGNTGAGKTNETWTFDLATSVWTEVNISESKPAPRDGTAAIFVDQESRMILFGGQNVEGTYLKDVWSLDLSLPVSVLSPHTANMPQQLRLLGNFPNPFNPNTAIAFELSTHGFVELKIYDVRGQLVAVLVDHELGPGRYELEWNGRNTKSQPVSTGIYVYRLKSGVASATGKMLLLK